MCAVLSHSTILTLVVVYYIAVFADLCSYLNMPLLIDGRPFKGRAQGRGCEVAARLRARETALHVTGDAAT